jgi:hypothetical protein
MIETILVTAARKSAQQISMGVACVFAVMFLHQDAAANPINLGSAANFAVLAGASVVNTGLSVINGGDVGVYPGASISGFPPGTITPPYTIHSGDSIAGHAETDLGTAYTAAAALAPNQALTGLDLGGMTLTPGVYFFSSSAQLTGTLTLNDLGNPNAVFVFQIGSTLTTAANSSVVTINGGANSGANVIWQIGSSAMLGANTAFEGNILAYASITLGAEDSLYDGRLLAETGTVTLNDDFITVPPPERTADAPDVGSTSLLLGSGLAALFYFKQRSSMLVKRTRRN